MTLNLGIALAQLGKRTVIADFGRSDLRRLLGLFRQVEGLRDYAVSGRHSIEPYMKAAPVPNLWVIGPGNEPNGGAALAYTPEQRLRVMRALAAIEADFVLADPQHVLRSYQFLKNALYTAILRRLGPGSETAGLIAQIGRSGRGPRTATMAQVTGLVRRRDPEEARAIDEICDAFAPGLIVNAGRSIKDMELGDKLRVICRRYLSVRLEYLGFVYEDPAIDRGHVIEDPIVLRQPNSRAAVALQRIAHKCVQSGLLDGLRPDPAVSSPTVARRPARAFTSDELGSLGGMLEGLLAGSVEREVHEVEREIGSKAEQADGGASGRGEPTSAERRILKTVFSPADLYALEDLIDSLDDEYFPDPKWRWKVRALDTPDRVVHHLISRGVQRDFFYRDLPSPSSPISV